jgi:amino acid adenylation domain-containing protein
VEHEGESITYRMLDRQSNRLASILIELGVRPGDAVGLFLTRGTPMIVGILATLKAGAAYVPQHVGVAPHSALRHVVDVARIRVVLTTSGLASEVEGAGADTIVAVDEIMSAPFDGDLDHVLSPAVERPALPSDRAFILFTSGTTGRPNGVQVTHGNVCNIVLTHPGDLGMGPGMRVGQILSIAFDMAAWEIHGALTHGATLVVRGDSIQKAAEQVDVIIATPSILGSLDASMCRNVSIVAVAGEPCPLPLAEAWAEFATFHNSCGPTETTIINTAQRFRPGGPLTIGSPTPNNTVYVLDSDLQPLPIGVVGEMWAGGECVTAGYIDDPELSADRYRPDPFLGGGRMMFRTRDLGRWTEFGELEHHGRTDDQVKIRGFRVELDSVSAVLESVPGCSQAVTLKYDDRTLIAFITPESADVGAARAAVADHLPYYCVPSTITAMPELPRTPRGKIDKRRLLETADEMLQAAPASGAAR